MLGLVRPDMDDVIQGLGQLEAAENASEAGRFFQVCFA